MSNSREGSNSSLHALNQNLNRYDFAYGPSPRSQPTPSPTLASNGFGSNSRFHSALEHASSTSRSHSAQPSTSSISLDAAAFPQLADSADGERAFAQLQRELSGSDGIVGLGFDTSAGPDQGRASRERTASDETAQAHAQPHAGMNSTYDSSATTRGLMSPGGHIYAEPEALDGFGALMSEQIAQAGGQNRPFGQRGKYGYGSIAHHQASMASNLSNTDDEFDETNQPPSASSSMGNLGGFGRPASMDIDLGGIASGDASEDNSFDFLLSPPGGDQSFGPAAGSSNRSVPFTGKSKAKDRTYPAPLLLKGDRPFAGPHPPSPVISQIAPLSIARKLSTSAGSSPAGSSNPSPSQGNALTRSQWTNQHAIQPGAEASQPMPYQRHRAKQSSTSSFQHRDNMTSSLPYSHSSQPSTSSAATSSPSMSHGGFSNSSTSASLSTAASHQPNSSTPATSVFSSSTGSFGSAMREPPISSQALLLHVLSLRSTAAPMSVSQSHGPPSRSATPMFAGSADPNHQRIRSVGSNAPSDSTADGEDVSPTRARDGSSLGKLGTVDLSHKRIDQVPIEVVDELKDEVEKLALGYNLLRALPSFFNGLHSLRYLNVRVNLLTVFPPVLCEMPSLEILDISRNKIKVLPIAPGTLVNLRVLSIAKNRVKRLPTWFAHLSRLQVLKIDHNPLEWPPKDITAYPSPAGLERPAPNKNEEEAEMNRWVLTLTTWIRNNAAKENARDPIPDRRRRPSYVSDIPSDDERSTGHGQEDPRTAFMTRTESGKIAVSPITPITAVFPKAVQHLTPPTAGLGIDDPQSDGAGHSRNNSHSTTQTIPEGRQTLKAKKSLPDLRQSHAEILAERMNEGGADNRSLGGPTAAPPGALRRLKDRPELFHSNSARAALPSHPSIPTVPARSQSVRPSTATNAPPAALNVSQPPISLNSLRSPSPGPGDRERERERIEFEPPPRPRNNKVVDSNGADRNSGAYFRRLSMLPASTISKAVPPNLLAFADSIRGILFSLSQIYSALRQFVVFASQDRLPAPIARLMGQADGSMSLLINALDRFDSLSRRGTPSPAIVRDIFTTCRDNVLTFKQLMAALGPQLKSLIATADVRYTRTLLLMLYGSMGEIANSWNAVTPLMNQLSEGDSMTTLILQPPTPSPRMDRTASQTGGPLGRARSKTRRHAGSFSVEDVQLGAEIPPAPMPEGGASSSMGMAPISAPAPTGDGYGASNPVTIKPRPGGIKGSRGPPGSITLPGAFNPREPPQGDGLLTPTAQPDFIFGEPVGPWSNGEGGSAVNSPVMSSVPHMVQETVRGTPSRSSSFSRPPGTTILGDAALSLSSGAGVRPGTAGGAASFDPGALDLIGDATKAAFDVYRMLLDSFDEDAAEDPSAAAQLMRELGPRRVKELTDLCIVGNESATKLRSMAARVIALLPEKNSPRFTGEYGRMVESANGFMQTVVRFAKLVKAISAEHGFSPKIRDGLANLTNLTKDMARFLNPLKTVGVAQGTQPMEIARGGGGSQPVGLGMMSASPGSFGQPGMMMVGGAGRI